MEEQTEDSSLEIVVGTYENFLLGFSLSCQPEVNREEQVRIPLIYLIFNYFGFWMLLR